MIFTLLALVILSLLGVLLSFAVLIDVVVIGHDFGTTKQGTKAVAEILRNYNKEKAVVYDLGSARGDFLLRLKKFSKHIKPVGIDSSGFRIMLSRCKSALLGRKIKFIRSDFNKLSFSGAEVVYIYLKQSDVDALGPKLKTRLKDGTMVITNTQNISAWQADQTFIVHPQKAEYEKMFVYVKS